MSTNYEDEVLKAAYKRAWYKADRGFVDPKTDIELDRAIRGYMSTHYCTYEEAYIFAKTGQKMGGLRNQ